MKKQSKRGSVAFEPVDGEPQWGTLRDELGVIFLVYSRTARVLGIGPNMWMHVLGGAQEAGAVPELAWKALLRRAGALDDGSVAKRAAAPVPPVTTSHREFVNIGGVLVDPARVAAIEPGDWDDRRKDSLAVLVLDTGARIETVALCKKAVAALTGGGDESAATS